MSVYQYIAFSNPQLAYEICKKYGYYDIQTEEEIAYCLQSIVARKGESSFAEIMQLHPDKEVILELYQPKIEKPIMEQERKRDCSCMLNADGVQNNTTNVASQTNLMILLAAMVISISIISMKK